MMLTEWFDQDVQGGLSHDSTVASQCRDELFSGLGWVQDSFKKGIPVRSDEHHPFMFLKDSASSPRKRDHPP